MTAQKTYWQDIRWQASGNAMAQLIGILGMPLLTRLYGPTDFAAQSLFNQVAMFMAGIVTLRLEYFLQLPKDHEDAGRLLAFLCAMGILLSGVLSLCLWLAGPLLAPSIFTADLVVWLPLAPWTALLISLSLALQHFAQRAQDYKSSGLAELSSKTAYIGIAAALSPVGHAIGLLMSTAFGAIVKGVHLWVTSVGSQLSSERPESLGGRMRSGAQAARRYARLSGSLVGSHLMATVTSGAPLLFLGQAYGSSTLGQFALVSATIFLPAGLLGAAIGQVYYQRAASEWAAGRVMDGLWKNTFARLLRYGLPAYLLIGLISPMAYPWIFGQQWQGAGELASCLSVSAFFSLISSPMDRTCLIVGAWRYPLFWHAARMATTLAVIAWAHFTQQPLRAFITALVSQMAALYVVDLLANRHFAQTRLGASDGQHHG